MSGRKPSLSAPGKCCLIPQSIFINALKRKQTLEDEQLFSVRLCVTLLSLTTVPHIPSAIDTVVGLLSVSGLSVCIFVALCQGHPTTLFDLFL